MGKMPQELKEIIARNIRACRLKHFPGRGGAKRCAEAFGVSPQQWSPWERGLRTPDEYRLRELAAFFGVEVEFLRREQSYRSPQEAVLDALVPIDLPDSVQEQPLSHAVEEQAATDTTAEMPASWLPEPPSVPERFYWLVDRFITSVMSDGLKISLDRESIANLAYYLKKND